MYGKQTKLIKIPNGISRNQRGTVTKHRISITVRGTLLLLDHFLFSGHTSDTKCRLAMTCSNKITFVRSLPPNLHYYKNVLNIDIYHWRRGSGKFYHLVHLLQQSLFQQYTFLIRVELAAYSRAYPTKDEIQKKLIFSSTKHVLTNSSFIEAPATVIHHICHYDKILTGAFFLSRKRSKINLKMRKPHSIKLHFYHKSYEQNKKVFQTIKRMEKHHYKCCRHLWTMNHLHV